MASEFLSGSTDVDTLSRRNVELGKQNVVPSFSPWEAAATNFLEADRVGSALWDTTRLKILGMSSFSKKTPAQLKEKYDIDVKENMNDMQALIIQELQNNKAKQTFVNANIDPYGAYRNALPIAGSIMGSIADPVGIGIGLAFDKGISMGAGALANIAKVSMSVNRAGRIGLGVARGLTAGAGEGFTEDFIFKSQAQAANLQYTDLDSAMNIGLSTVAGGILGGIGGIFDNVPARNFKKAQETAAVYEAGKAPQLEFMDRMYDKDRYGRFDQGTSGKPGIESPSPRGTFYSSHSGASDVFNGNSQRTFGTSFGTEVVATRNKDFAYNEATSVMDNTSGHIVDINAENLTLLNIDQAAPDNVKAAIKTKLDEIAGPDSGRFKKALDESPDTATFLESIGKLTDSELSGADVGRAKQLQKGINEAIESQGWDGITWRHKKSDGTFTGGNEDIGIGVFKADKVNAKGFEKVQATKDTFRPDLSKEMSDYGDYLNSKQSSLLYDDVTNTTIEATDPFPRVPTLDEEIATLRSDLSDLESEAIAADIVKKPKEGAEVIDTRSPETFREAAKAASFCVRDI